MSEASSTAEKARPLPLGLLAPGERGEVMRLLGPKGLGHRHGMPADLVRLEEMGLRAGTHVEVLANEGHGPLLMRVGESRIAIGRGLAMKIQVHPLDGRDGGGCSGSCAGGGR